MLTIEEFKKSLTLTVEYNDETYEHFPYVIKSIFDDGKNKHYLMDRYSTKDIDFDKFIERLYENHVAFETVGYVDMSRAKY